MKKKLFPYGFWTRLFIYMLGVFCAYLIGAIGVLQLLKVCQ